MAKKITIADIARVIGISPTTVSFVLNKKNDKGISSETRDKVLSVAEKLGYRPKVKISRVGWIRAIFLVRNLTAFNYHTTFYSGVYNYLSKTCSENNIELSMGEFPYEDDKDFILSYKKFAEDGYDVFLCNDPRIVTFLKKMNHKVVLVQSDRMDDTICIHCDDFAAGTKAAMYAYKMGHRRAGLICHGLDGERMKGFMTTFTSLGGVCDDKYVWDVDWELHELESVVAEKSKSPDLPSFFYCFSDNMLFYAIRGFAKNNIRVPDDVSIMGTDNLYWGRLNNPAFTTIDLNELLFGEKLLESIKHAYDGNSTYHLAVPVNLVERETVKKITE